MSNLQDSKSIPDDVLAQLGDRYSKYKYISSGATSSVYQAHDAILDKTIAVKILKHPDQKVLMRFQQEAKALSQLEHSSLVQILDFNVTNKNHAYLIMEFVKGEALSTIQERTGALSIDQALKITLQICKGMAHAHSKNITHRDLKTSNIIVDNLNNPQVTVVDFGLAVKQAQDDTVVQNQAQTKGFSTTEGKIQGSPLYMSPEQAEGKETDHRSDIYSLGCIFFKLLTGETPFQSDDLMDVLRKHVKEKPPKLADINEEVDFPKHLELITAKMLSKNPMDRYQSMDEVRLALKTPDSSPDDSSEDDFSAKKKKGNLPIYLAFTSAIVVASVLIYFILVPKDSIDRKNTAQSLDRLTQLRNGFELGANPNFDVYKSGYWYQPSLSTNKSLKDSDMEYVATLIEEQKAKAREIIKAEQEVKKDEIRRKKLHLVEEKDSEEKEAEPTPRYLNMLKLIETKISGDGLKYLVGSGIERLDLSKSDLSPAAYDYLSQMSNLKTLLLSESTINNTNLKKLWQSKTIEDLTLDNCIHINDDGLKGIENCKSLNTISINFRKTKQNKKLPASKNPKTEIALGKNITNKSLVNMSKSMSLKKIYIDATVVNDDGIKSFLEVPHRKNHQVIAIQVNVCRGITSKSIKLLTELNPKLEYLGICFTSVKPEDLKYLPDFKRLKHLAVAGIEIGPEQLKIIGSLKTLQFLYMTKVYAKDEDLKYLYNFDNIKSILMYETPYLTEKGVKALRNRYKRGIEIFCPLNAAPDLEKVRGLLDVETDSKPLNKKEDNAG